MWPVVLDLGWLTIHGYGLMILLGAALSCALITHQAHRTGLPELAHRLPALVCHVVAAAFVGGKLPLWLLYTDTRFDPTTTAGWRDALGGGFVYHGSLLAGLAVLVWRLRATGLPVRRSLDLILLTTPLLHAFGRLGCFAAGCCHGYATTCPLGVTFAHGVGLNGVPLHPVQLYEAGGELVIFGLLWLAVWPRRRFAGQTALSYLLLYGILRCASELLRGDGNAVFWGARVPPTLGEAPRGFTEPQLTCLVVALVSAVLLWRSHPRTDSAVVSA